MICRGRVAGRRGEGMRGEGRETERIMTREEGKDKMEIELIDLRKKILSKEKKKILNSILILILENFISMTLIFIKLLFRKKNHLMILKFIFS